MLALASSCSLGYPPNSPKWKPEAVAPSVERLAVLMDGPEAVYKEAPLQVRLYPQIIMAGGATWMTCHVPPSWPREARIVRMFEGVFRSDVPLDRNWPRLVAGIPCGTWAYACIVYDRSGELARITQAVEIQGCS